MKLLKPKALLQSFLITFLTLLIYSTASYAEDLVLGDDDIAMVGQYPIKKNDFYRGIDLLHTSSTVGEALKGQSRSFPKADFQGYFQDMVASKLVLIEAEKLKLHEKKDIKEKLQFHKINLCLDRLREDEIERKVKVMKKDVYDYYLEKKIEEELEKREKLKKFKEEQSAEADDESGSEAELEDLDSDEYRVKTLKEMPEGDYEGIVKGFQRVQKAELQKNFFETLKKKARIKIYKKVIKKVSQGDIAYADKTIAKIKGRKFTAREVWVRLPNDEWKDEQKVKEMVDQVVLAEILDREALKRGYEKEPAIATQIARFREKTLNQAFKDEVINGLIVVSEEEKKKFYNDNIEKYKYIDEVNLSIIKVTKEDEANEIIADLNSGSEFSFLAKKMSLDKSRINGGVLGWVAINTYPGLDINNVRSANKGSVAGPFLVGRAYVILQLNGYREGKTVPYSKVTKGIDLRIGKTMVEPTLEKYIDRLKKTIPIKYNEEELSIYSIKGL